MSRMGIVHSSTNRHHVLCFVGAVLFVTRDWRVTSDIRIEGSKITIHNRLPTTMLVSRTKKSIFLSFLSPHHHFFLSFFLWLYIATNSRCFRSQVHAAVPLVARTTSSSSCINERQPYRVDHVDWDRHHVQQQQHRHHYHEKTGDYALKWKRRQGSSFIHPRSIKSSLSPRPFAKMAWIIPPVPTTSLDHPALGLVSSDVATTAAASSSSLPSSSLLWILRGASALLSYAGCVAYWDRPRGGEDLVLPATTTAATTTTSVTPMVSIFSNHHNYNNRCLQVAPSTIAGAGLGLFATERLDAGTKLGTYPGVVVPLAQHVKKLQVAPHCEAYIWRFSDQTMLIDPTNSLGYLDDTCRGGNPHTPGSTLLFATIFSNWQVPTTLCRINEPPLGRDVNVITVEDVGKRQVALILERDVYPGEELFMDYGRDYDRTWYRRTGVDLDDGSL